MGTEDSNKFIVLYPGKFKPFHDGYLSVMISYLNSDELDIDELRVIVSKTPNDGLEAEDTLPFLEKICSVLSERTGIWIHAVNTIGKSPYRDCSWEAREHPENDYTIASNYTSSDEYEWIYNQFDNAYDCTDKIDLIEVNDGDDISSEDLKQYCLDKDYESFRKAYNFMVDDLNLVTEEDVQGYFDVLCDKISPDEDSNLEEKVQNSKNINTENYINEKMFKSNKNTKQEFSINVTALKESCQDIRFNDMRDEFRKRGALVEGLRENNQHIMAVKNISENAFCRVLNKYGLDAEYLLYEGELYDDDDFLDKEEDFIYDSCCFEEDDAMDECGIAEDYELDESFSNLLFDDHIFESSKKETDYFGEVKAAIKELGLNSKDRIALLQRVTAISRAKDCEKAKEEIHAFAEICRELDVKSSALVRKLESGAKTICKNENCKEIKESLNTRVNNAINRINEAKILTDRAKQKLSRQLYEKRAATADAAVSIINENMMNGAIRNNLSATNLKERIALQIEKGSKTLYENTKVNGNPIKNLSLQQIKNYILESAQTVGRLKKEANKTLNESAIAGIRGRYNKTKKLISILLEEYEYRRLYKSLILNENDEEPSTEDMNKLVDMFGGDEFSFDEPAEDKDGESNKDKSDDNAEEAETSDKGEEDKGEEVELSGIVFTMKNKAAADELISACEEAGVPKDAFEFVEDENGDDAEDADETAEDAEADSDAEAEDKGDAEANEAFKAFSARYRALFEDEDGEPEEDSDSDDEDVDLNDPDAKASEDADDDKAVKVRLSNTDYIHDVAKVLEDVYGITKKELEDMIGGDIVDEEEDTDSEDSKKEDDEDETNSDEISSDDVFGGF